MGHIVRALEVFFCVRTRGDAAAHVEAAATLVPVDDGVDLDGHGTLRRAYVSAASARRLHAATRTIVVRRDARLAFPLRTRRVAQHHAAPLHDRFNILTRLGHHFGCHVVQVGLEELALGLERHRWEAGREVIVEYLWHVHSKRGWSDRGGRMCAGTSATEPRMHVAHLHLHVVKLLGQVGSGG